MTTLNGVGIWIDHQQAVVIFASQDHATARTVKSHVAAHPHFGGSQMGGGEKKYEERFEQQLNHFYDEVIGQLGHPDSMLILGPGEAKTQLATRLERVKALAGAKVSVEAADDLTEPQIIARVKQHFDLKR
ncbi:MAG: hypothetical protein ABL986_03070 [Vicinamibacterales bacterium]